MQIVLNGRFESVLGGYAGSTNIQTYNHSNMGLVTYLEWGYTLFGNISLVTWIFVFSIFFRFFLFA